MDVGGAAARPAGLHGKGDEAEARMRGLGDTTRTDAIGLWRASAAAAAAGVVAASLVAVAVPAAMGLRTAMREWAEAGRAAADAPNEGRAVLVGCFVIPAGTRAAAVPFRCPPLPAAVVAAVVVVFFFSPPRGAA